MVILITLDATQLIVTIIGSNALFTFVQFMITRHDKKKEKQSDETKGMRDMILGLGHDKLLFLSIPHPWMVCKALNTNRIFKVLSYVEIDISTHQMLTFNH